MERLGLGYEVLSKINPRLVYGTLRGFGDPRTALSPYQDWPAFDVIAQAMGGIMAITGPNAKTPTKVRSEEHTSELQSLMRISYAVFCLKKKTVTQRRLLSTRTHQLV